MEKLNMGIVGVAGRPRSFLSAIDDSKVMRLRAVCDLNQERMDAAISGIEGVQTFTSYEDMIEQGNLDAIIIGTPMFLHVSQAIMALAHHIHVFSEVTAAVTMEECKALVQAVRNSKATYMLAENCNYYKPHMMIKAMIKAGLFGHIHYAEGEYLHNIRDLAEKTTWRKKWQLGINGITYGTHSLGPILSWFEGDRIVKISCMGSGHHHQDAQGNGYGMESTSVILAKTLQGRLIKVRQDLQSVRPNTLNYILQGTKGAYESSRRHDGKHLVWLESRSQAERWSDLDDFEKEYLPEIWAKYGETAKKSGHNGSDYLIMTDFIHCIINNRPSPIGIHEAMDMTIPGLISQVSIQQDGEWLDVPDSREW